MKFLSRLSFLAEAAVMEDKLGKHSGLDIIHSK